jgi:hypothetical protein
MAISAAPKPYAMIAFAEPIFPFLKIGRNVRYRLSDVLAYEQAHAMTSTGTSGGVARRSKNGSPLD